MEWADVEPIGDPWGGDPVHGELRVDDLFPPVRGRRLDGGGSSEMVVEGEVVNRPSDGDERSISNAIVVLPGPDPGEE